jgi:hypothetical protein
MAPRADVAYQGTVVYRDEKYNVDSWSPRADGIKSSLTVKGLGRLRFTVEPDQNGAWPVTVEKKVTPRGAQEKATIRLFSREEKENGQED